MGRQSHDCLGFRWPTPGKMPSERPLAAAEKVADTATGQS
jgi:hypothetical protein